MKENLWPLYDISIRRPDGIRYEKSQNGGRFSVGQENYAFPNNYTAQLMSAYLLSYSGFKRMLGDKPPEFQLALPEFFYKNYYQYSSILLQNSKKNRRLSNWKVTEFVASIFSLEFVSRWVPSDRSSSPSSQKPRHLVVLILATAFFSCHPFVWFSMYSCMIWPCRSGW